MLLWRFRLYEDENFSTEHLQGRRKLGLDTMLNCLDIHADNWIEH